MSKILFTLCFFSSLWAISQEPAIDERWRVSEDPRVAASVSSDTSGPGVNFNLPMEPETYRLVTGFTSNCGYARVYRDGRCETDRWTRDGDGSEFVWNGSGEFEMRCQREQMDRDTDRANEPNGLIGRTIYREVVVRFRENAQDNRDDARRSYIEIEEGGVSRRIEVGSARNFRFEDCNISRGPRPSRPSGAQCDSVTSCLIRNADVELDGEMVRVNIQF